MPRTTVPFPSGGLDLTSAPFMGRKETAKAMKNFLVGYEGKGVLRGPVVSRVAVATNQIYTALPSRSTNRYAVQRADGTVEVVEATSKLLSKYAPVAGPAGGFASSGYSELNGIVYAPHGGPGLLKWTGGTLATDFTVLGNAPKAAYAVEAHLARIFAVGKWDPGAATQGTTYNLYWSDVNWDGTNTLDRWQDDVSGLVNKITIGSAGGEPVDLVSWQGKLYIFREHAIQALLGSTTSSFTLREVARVGALTGTSIETTDEGIYFKSDRGWMVFDGVAVAPASPQMQLLKTPGVIPGQNLAAAIELPNGYLGVIDLIATAPGGTSDRHMYLYHRPSGAWAEMDATLSAGAVRGLARTDNTQVAWNDTELLLLNYVTQPEAAIGDNAAPGLDFGVTAYIATATSRPVRLNAPWGRSFVKRIAGRGVAVAPTGSPKWHLRLRDEKDVDRVSTAATPAVGTNADVVQTLRKDSHVEIDDAITMHWQLDPSGAQPTRAEVYDAYVEWEPSHDLTV